METENALTENASIHIVYKTLLRSEIHYARVVPAQKRIGLEKESRNEEHMSMNTVLGFVEQVKIALSRVV
jgi:hypothetical protein